VVQRCPAVPTAPNTMAGTANFKSAVSSTIIALLPLNSSNERPKRRATISFTWRPTAVEPVKEIKATRLSFTKDFAISTLSEMNKEELPCNPLRSISALQICCTAIAHNGVFGDGFHTTVVPQIAAINAFHAHTATGKLNAV